MSIRINSSKCIGCGKCSNICPGNLICMKGKKAFIEFPKECWGCTACMKECKFEAIELTLGADVGGNEASMTVRIKSGRVEWKIAKGEQEINIEVDPMDSNKY